VQIYKIKCYYEMWQERVRKVWDRLTGCSWIMYCCVVIGFAYLFRGPLKIAESVESGNEKIFPKNF
jgi:hypothetical protein